MNQSFCPKNPNENYQKSTSTKNFDTIKEVQELSIDWGQLEEFFTMIITHTIIQAMTYIEGIGVVTSSWPSIL